MDAPPGTTRFWRLRFLTVALPALLAGAFGFVREPLEQRFHLPAVAGNGMTALLALVGGLVYFQTAYALATRLAEDARRAQAERQVLLDRHALADELHDSIAQTLFFLNVRLRHAVQRAAELGAGDLATLLGEAASANRTAYGQLRQTIRQLAPEQTGYGGGTGIGAGPGEAPGRLEALVRMAERELAGSGIAVVPGADEAAPPARSARVLEAILTEALRNVRKHSGASSVRVWLAGTADRGSAGIADDGCGFRPEAARGYGLGAARRRAEQAGLALSVRSAPGAGTEVEVAWGDGREERA